MNKEILSNQPSSDQPSSAQLSESYKVKLEKSNLRGKRSRDTIKDNEKNGKLLANTTPLLVCGKDKMTTQNNQKRTNFMQFCKDIISEGGIRNGCTTYPGNKSPSYKTILPTHLYHRIPFFCEGAKTLYSEEKAVNKMGSLADGESEISFDKSHTYEDTNFLSSIRSTLCESISKKRNFQGVLKITDGK